MNQREIDQFTSILGPNKPIRCVEVGTGLSILKFYLTRGYYNQKCQAKCMEFSKKQNKSK